MAEQGDLVAKTTTAQAAEADKYEKNLNRLTLTKDALYKTIAVNLIPTLNDFLKIVLASANETTACAWKAATRLGRLYQILGTRSRHGDCGARRHRRWRQEPLRPVRLVGGGCVQGHRYRQRSQGKIGLTGAFTDQGRAEIKAVLDERARFVEAADEDMARRFAAGATPYSDKLRAQLPRATPTRR